MTARNSINVNFAVILCVTKIDAYYLLTLFIDKSEFQNIGKLPLKIQVRSHSTKILVILIAYHLNYGNLKLSTKR